MVGVKIIHRCGQDKQSFCNIVLFILDSEIEEESEEDEDYIPSEDWKKVVRGIFSQSLNKLILKSSIIIILLAILIKLR